jgi:anti-anti-sigma factor
VHLVLAGELDGGAGAALMAEFERLASGDGMKKLILDMQRLTFIDSGGMRAIIHVERAASRQRFDLQVIEPPEAVTDCCARPAWAGGCRSGRAPASRWPITSNGSR